MEQTAATLLEIASKLAQELIQSIYEIFVYASANYFRFAVLSFLIFWVLFKDRLAHIRIQPRPKKNQSHPQRSWF